MVDCEYSCCKILALFSVCARALQHETHAGKIKGKDESGLDFDIITDCFVLKHAVKSFFFYLGCKFDAVLQKYVPDTIYQFK